MPAGFSSTALNGAGAVETQFSPDRGNEVVGGFRIEVGVREQLQEVGAVPAGGHHHVRGPALDRASRCDNRSAGMSIITGTMRAGSMYF